MNAIPRNIFIIVQWFALLKSVSYKISQGAKPHPPIHKFLFGLNLIPYGIPTRITNACKTAFSVTIYAF